MSDRIVSITALVLSLCSLGWQVYDSTLKRVERISWTAAPSLSNVRIEKGKGTGTRYGYYITNNGEGTVYLLEVQPSILFGAQKLPATGKKLEPGEVHIIYTEPFEENQSGMKSLMGSLEFVSLESLTNTQARVRTTKGEHLFPLDLMVRHASNIEQTEHIRRTRDQSLEMQDKPAKPFYRGNTR